MTCSRPPRALLPVLSMSCLILFAGCSRETDDWRGAQAADTVAAYEQFAREHPASAHAAEATARAAQLVEDDDWRRAQEQDSLQAYQLFLTQHPESRWTQEARVRVETITLGNSANSEPVNAAVLPSDAVGAADAPVPPPAAGPHPATPPAAAPAAPRATAPAPAVAAASPPAGGFGVQLGAFASETAARSQWGVIAGKHAPQLQGRSPRIAAASTAAGPLFRLQTPTRNEAEARELCRALGAAGQACVVVHP